MKKLLTLAAVAAGLGFCALSAKASIGITTNYTPLNISFTVITNSLPVTNSAGVVTTITGRVKFDNSTLLKLFASWATNTWPAGAKLVIGWDAPWNGLALVVDKSGTNVLYDPRYTGLGVETSFYTPFVVASGPISEKIDPTNAAGSFTETEYSVAAFVLQSDTAVLTNTVIVGLGNSTAKFTQNWDKNGDYTTWSLDADMASGQYYYEGEEKYLGGVTTVSGSLKTSGGGKGQNSSWYPRPPPGP